MKMDVQISCLMLTLLEGSTTLADSKQALNGSRVTKGIDMKYCPLKPTGNFLCRDLGQVIAWRKRASYCGPEPCPQDLAFSLIRGRFAREPRGKQRPLTSRQIIVSQRAAVAMSNGVSCWTLLPASTGNKQALRAGSLFQEWWAGVHVFFTELGMYVPPSPHCKIQMRRNCFTFSKWRIFLTWCPSCRDQKPTNCFIQNRHSSLQRVLGFNSLLLLLSLPPCNLSSICQESTQNYLALKPSPVTPFLVWLQPIFFFYNPS